MKKKIDPTPNAPNSPNTTGSEPTAAQEATPPNAETALCLLVSTAKTVAIVPIEPDTTYVLGREGVADIVIDDPSVSRRHARLVTGPRIVLTDLGSSNGTKVNGRLLANGDEAALAVGTSIDLGGAVVVLQRARGLIATVKERGPTIRPSRAAAPPGTSGPVVHDEAMLRIFGLLDLIAPTPLSVLVLGETGVGKEVFAEEIDKRSLRAERPFLQINCAALPDALLEGELFGYEKGAFTGAAQAKAGLFESADEGTVFLDEIGEVPLSTQAKLLRVLESGEVMRIGGLRPKRVDVRFVSATNRDLNARIMEGAFRQDLYFRLNGVALTLPPLRERSADIVPLAEHFAQRLSEKLGRPTPRIGARAIAALKAGAFPGNVRELKNLIERAVVMSRGGEIEPEHFLDGLGIAKPLSVPPARDSKPRVSPETRIQAPSREQVDDERVEASESEGTPTDAPSDDLKSQLEAFEKTKIVDALEKCGGNQSAAARMLGITRRLLINRIEQWGLARPRKGRDPA